MRSKLKLSRSLEFISVFFKEQQVINTRGGGANWGKANLAPPPVLIGLKWVWWHKNWFQNVCDVSGGRA